MCWRGMWLHRLILLEAGNDTPSSILQLREFHSDSGDYVANGPICWAEIWLQVQLQIFQFQLCMIPCDEMLPPTGMLTNPRLDIVESLNFLHNWGMESVTCLHLVQSMANWILGCVL
jgi:hypothetical protein